MRKPLIAGNWKMNKTPSEAGELARILKDKLEGESSPDIVLCPPFTALDVVARAIQGSHLGLGAQNLYWKEEGAYTGEVSASMLKELGCRYVIIGHSERRQYFGESNETVNRKVKAALKFDLIPLVCVGERLEEREEGKTFSVVENHIREGLRGLEKQDILRMIVAYEPVWAIGTGRTATPQQANEVHGYLRELLADIYGTEIAYQVRIIYGGSVSPNSVSGLMAEAEIDGALVGGASLQADSFAEIVQRTG
ncbi:triose-phosphate isomerase [candidate division NPL-UPA2 bacterium]|nr:triose-phosphate isomerase [candidate division NPL-UPA2 bacterium]